MTSRDFPTGSVMPFAESHVAPLLASGEWHRADGSRIRRHDDPALYDLLRPNWRRKWRRWVVHLPNFEHRTVFGGIDVAYLIRTSVPA